MVSLIRGLSLAVRGSFYFVAYNLFLLLLIGFFTYRTFFVGRLNWALLVLLVALTLITICRVLSQYRISVTNTLLYRVVLLAGVGLLIGAACIQTFRFVYVFLPGLADPTVSEVLVRIGIATATFYGYAVVVAFVYYLYAHEMTKAIWNGSVDRVLESTFVQRKKRNWQQVQFSTMVLLRTVFWGGLASVVTLAVGFVAWLLR